MVGESVERVGNGGGSGGCWKEMENAGSGGEW